MFSEENIFVMGEKERLVDNEKILDSDDDRVHGIERMCDKRKRDEGGDGGFDDVPGESCS